MLHDLRCRRCRRVSRDLAVNVGALPACRCGGEQAIDWSHGKAPATDLHAPSFNHATGKYHQTCREADLEMARQCRAWNEKNPGRSFHAYPAGDKVGGARQELGLRGTAFAYTGQSSRKSTREHELERRAQRGGEPKRWKHIPTVERTVNGISPRRSSAEAHRTLMRSPTWRD